MRTMVFFVMFAVVLAGTAVAEDLAYRERMERIAKYRDEETTRRHELQKLELQYKIYCKEMEMQKDIQYNMFISSPRMSQNTDIDIRNKINQKMQRINTAK